MNKIKILFVLDHFHTASGGTEGQIYELIKGLDKSLFHVEACIFRQETDYLKREGFPCPVFSPGIRSFFDPSSCVKLIELRNYISRNNFDIVQTVFNDSALSVPPLTVGLKTKIVSTRRDMGFWYTPMKVATLRANVLLTDAYLVNSRPVQDNLHKIEWAPLRKIFIIHNGLNMSRFNASVNEDLLEQLCIPKGSPIVGIVANMRPVKRVGDLVQAFIQVEKQIHDAHLIIVGHLGQLYEEYSSLAMRHNIEKKVHFLGMVQDPIPIIKLFTVGVNCSDSEGMSNAVMEYMVCNVSVVATDTSGNRELVEHNKNGMLVPVGDSNELAHAINILLGNQHLRQRLSSKSREHICNQFDMARVVDQYMTFYHDLLIKTE